ncbi:MAG: hypothetical protein GXY53_10435 [Desulfobulbus sp.]|nr:hypothetical protein [Desulfobulbus sp.]
MKPYLNIPFLPEKRYIEFLTSCIGDLDSIHFSLSHNQRNLDNRVRIEPAIARQMNLNCLKQLSGPKKYVLLNSRFYPPEMLHDADGLVPLIRDLEYYLEQGVLDGLIYCDHYLIQALADKAPDIAAQLEAVPGVNMMLDSLNKIEFQFNYIGATGFKTPAKIILDRSLNRNLDGLASLCLELRQQLPDIRIEVLANEGCLAYCPYKLSHDSYIALANMTGHDHTQALNCSFGCIRLLSEQPYRLLQSPFIRPEDIDLYLFHVDTIKLCGRTLGSTFLSNTITAYRNRKYDGNLLDLMDSMAWLAERMYVDNSLLSFDFANILSQCDNRCELCGFCEELFVTIARELPLSIKDLRAAAD